MNTPVRGPSGEPDVIALVGGRTDAGRHRSDNQDNFLIAELADSEAILLRHDSERTHPDTRITIGDHGLLLLVADGMGGAAAGSLASGLACSFILAELQESWVPDDDTSPDRFARQLQGAVEKANTRIHQHARRNAATAGMGCTVTAAGVLGGFIYIAQVGDSRAYLSRGGVTTQITRDQSLVQHMLDAGAIRPEEAEHSAHANVILQALGVNPTIEVDVTYQELCRGDSLVLCTDGLHRVVRTEEITDSIHRHTEPTAICDELIDLANARGGPDNVTVVAAVFAGDALPAPRAGDYVGRTEYPFTGQAAAM